MIFASPHSSERPSNISGSLQLPPTVATGYMTSDDCCYYWARDTLVAATSPHNNDGHSDISGPSLLAPTVATDTLTPAVYCYWTTSSDELYDISGPSLLDSTVAMIIVNGN
jgi:hypothetical protein